MRNKILSVAGAVLLTCLAASQVSADGLVFRPVDHKGSLNERSQEAIIIFHKGDKPGEATQDLILKISVQGDVDQFAWVVPLPSVPQTGEEDAKLFEELHKYVQTRLVAGGVKPKAENSLNSSAEAAPATARDVEVISREVVGSFDVSIVKETLVDLDTHRKSFPEIPGVEPPESFFKPYRLDPGPRWHTQGIADNVPPEMGPRYGNLVPQVDSDGNELAGIHLPDIAVPLATNAGWRVRPKGSLYEGGLRVPAIISWPGHLPENEVRSQMATSCDWYLFRTMRDPFGI